MTDNSREQSQTDPFDYDRDTALLASKLGPFKLVVSAPDLITGEDGFAYVPSGKAQLVLTNTETGETLLDEEVTPMFGAETNFTAWDKDDWYATANRSITALGLSLDELAAQGNAA